MITTLLVVHSIIVLLMIGAILLQKGESGGLVSSQNSMMSARGTKNFFTRTTAVLATLFFVNSIVLALLIKSDVQQKASILQEAMEEAEETAPEASQTEAENVNQEKPEEPQKQ